jgi:hypothetical protein
MTSRRRDLDLAARGLLGLRDPGAENTVLHIGLDAILIDWLSEIEGARKLASAAFGDQELDLILILLVLLILIPSIELSTGLAGCAPILGCALLLLFATLSDGASGTLTPTNVAWECVGSFDTAPNGEGLGVGELDLNILLIDTRKLTV